MTGAVERDRKPRPAVEARRRVRRSWLFAALTATSLACGSACTANGAGAASALQPGTANTALGSSPGIPAADAQSIRDTIEAMNTSAAEGVAEQQATLAAVVEPALAKALDDCAPATTTWHFEPIYRGLRPIPGWSGSNGPLTGTVYALPTLIRVYTGDRITGTDLTTLHFGVQAGEAYLTPLCAG